VLALLSDSTNAERAGWTPTETIIDEAFDRVFQNAKGRIIVATFASLINRIQQVANAAKRYNRKIAATGYSMVENIKMATELGYLDLPKDLVIPLDEVSRLPPERVAIMSTGTQGEPSAVLSRLATGHHRQLDIRPGDTVVMSAHIIPGNEEMVSRTINKLIQRGANVLYHPVEMVHVSGHASREELKLMLNLVRPKYFIPVHGELRQLTQHCKLAVFVDGMGVGDVGRAVMRDRETLARDGFVFAVLVMDSETGKLLDEPELISRGFVYVPEAEELFEDARERIRDIVAQFPLNGNGAKKLEERIESALKGMFQQETKRRPMIFVHVNLV